MTGTWSRRWMLGFGATLAIAATIGCSSATTTGQPTTTGSVSEICAELRTAGEQKLAVGPFKSSPTVPPANIEKAKAAATQLRALGQPALADEVQARIDAVSASTSTDAARPTLPNPSPADTYSKAQCGFSVWNLGE